MKKEKENSETTLTSPPTGGTIQIGSIVAYYGTIAPDTWLLCNGDAIPAQYNTLISLVGANTPNLCSRVIMGVGSGKENNVTFTVELGDTGGQYEHTLSLTEMPCHQHLGFGESSDSNWGTGRSSSTGYTGTGDNDKDNYLYGSSFTGGNPTDLIGNTNNIETGKATGTTNAHNNVQPYLAINYIIYAGTN
ncbi:MAG TPA: tail fiber protein [Bacteroidia bacterium]|nr:tail fiber protein [Bacteroidia bacterium]